MMFFVPVKALGSVALEASHEYIFQLGVYFSQFLSVSEEYLWFGK